MPLKTSSEDELPTINMTSMIDVVLVLILFFMVGTQFNNNEQRIDIKLPSVNTLNPMVAKPQRREVQVTATGATYLDGQPVSIYDLTQRLTEMRRVYPDLAVAVRADSEVKHRDLAPVYVAVSKAGITVELLGIRDEKLR